MDNKLDESGSRRWLVWSGLYTVIVLVLAGILNYLEPFTSDPIALPSLWQWIIWGSLYLPIVVLPVIASLKVTDFGFSLNLFLALVIALILPICAYVSLTTLVSWRGALIEAFARTGEEVFFRGFLILLFSRLFRGKRRPWLWAVIVSSLLFALVHTQTFQPGYLAQYGSSSMPAGYQVAERLLNVFGLALAFALLRVWTRSILPGAIAHSLLAGGIAALPFVLLIYAVALIWAWRRGEPVILRINGLGRLV
jgi:membrane protease YdiL (CAAX protease family)